MVEPTKGTAKKKRAAKKKKATPPPEPGQRILSLQVENVKRISAVQITPTGHLVVVSGANASGKSSVLDAIEYALAGTRSHPAEPVRRGADKARVVLDLGDLLVRRTITANGGGTLTVESKEGAVFRSPQALLDRLTGHLAFDPLGFLALSAPEQKVTLERLVGLDMSDLDERRRKMLDAIAAHRREEVAAVEGAKAVGVDLTLPEDEIAASALMAELETAQSEQTQNDAVRAEEQDLGRGLQDWKDRLGECLEHIEELAAALDAAKTVHVEAEKAVATAELASAQAAIAVEVLVDPDFVAIRARITQADETNARIRDNQEHGRLVARAQEAESAGADEREKLAEVNAERETRLAAATFPVPGLGFNEDGVAYAGLPFEQASRSEQIEVSVAMALAGNPTLRVMLVREGNDLDPEHVTLLAKLAEKHDAQVWLERVQADQKCAIVIVDGHVEGVVEPVAEDGPNLPAEEKVHGQKERPAEV